jgi:hypothetical protein
MAGNSDGGSPKAWLARRVLGIQFRRLKNPSNDDMLILAGLVLLVTAVVMIWPFSSRSRWDPSGRVRASLMSVTTC